MIIMHKVLDFRQKCFSFVLFIISPFCLFKRNRHINLAVEKVKSVVGTGTCNLIKVCILKINENK